MEPSPVDHWIWVTLPVAVTLTAPAVAVALFGPQVVGVTVSHNQTGSPTMLPFPPTLGAIPVCGPTSTIVFTACWARAATLTAPPYPGGGLGNQRAEVPGIPLPVISGLMLEYTAPCPGW